jgi:hypothetical protein
VTGAFCVSKNASATITVTGAGSSFDGRNYTDGTTTLSAASPSVDGLSSSNSADLTNKLNGGIPVQGLGGGPSPADVKAYGSSQPDFTSLPDQLKALADTTITTSPGSNQTWGTSTNPKIVYCALNGATNSKPTTGYGILILDGNNKFSQTVGWHGLIIVRGSATLTNVDNFWGAVIFCGTGTSWTQNNNGIYRYSADAIANVWTKTKAGNGGQKVVLTQGSWKE